MANLVQRRIRLEVVYQLRTEVEYIYCFTTGCDLYHLDSCLGTHEESYYNYGFMHTSSILSLGHTRRSEPYYYLVNIHICYFIVT